MKKAIALLVLQIIVHLIAVSSAEANFRDRIKEKIIERQSEKPAPATDQAVSKIEKAGDYTFSISMVDQTRYYKLHVPSKYNSARPSALLVALHGGGGDMTIQATEKFYHQISKSDSEGYVVVFPNGYSPFPSGKFATWNAGKCCGKARDLKTDDVSFIKEIVKKTQAQLNIDSQRIFAAGMSNGGMMAYRLACEAPQVFRAIAAVAGTDNTEICQPSNAVSVLHIHAKDDDHVLFAGGAGEKAFKDLSQVTSFTSVAASIEKWRTLNSCEEKPQRVFEKKGATCDLFKACKEKSRLQLCVTDEGGHSWPGGKKPSPFAGGSPTKAISANDVMWDFFNSL